MKRPPASHAFPLLLSVLFSIFCLKALTAEVAAENIPNVKPDTSWTFRVITEAEIERLSRRDADLSPSAVHRILAKLNARDFDYIAKDIQNGTPMRVPNDFAEFRDWTPLQKYISDVSDLPKFILIIKDMSYIGWYEHGKLSGDTYICTGKKEDATGEGLYNVLQKDLTHVSKSYPNAFGQPAPMPWALRIYGTVWIHAGDIAHGNCSHGCINLPVFPAMRLFDWATVGTPVVIVNSLQNVPLVLAKNRSNCTLHASACRPSRNPGKPNAKKSASAREASGNVLYGVIERITISDQKVASRAVILSFPPASRHAKTNAFSLSSAAIF
jgi:lipoprotein-anchoring transpeptidase ErfK/SrfK